MISRNHFKGTGFHSSCISVIETLFHHATVEIKKKKSKFHNEKWFTWKSRGSAPNVEVVRKNTPREPALCHRQMAVVLLGK